MKSPIASLFAALFCSVAPVVAGDWDPQVDFSGVREQMRRGTAAAAASRPSERRFLPVSFGLKWLTLEPSDARGCGGRTLEAAFADGYALTALRVEPNERGSGCIVSYWTPDGGYNRGVFEKRPFFVSQFVQAPSGIYHRIFTTLTGGDRFDHTGLETVLVHPSRTDRTSSGGPSVGVRIDGLLIYYWSGEGPMLRESRYFPDGGFVEFKTPIRHSEAGRQPPPTEGELVHRPDERAETTCSLAQKSCRDLFQRLVQRARFDR